MIGELSDDQIDQAPVADLRAAYRALRDHHIAETAALISRRDDLTRRRDGQLAKNQEILAESQRLLDHAAVLMRADEETIDQLGSENARLSEMLRTQLAARMADQDLLGRAYQAGKDAAASGETFENWYQRLQ